MATFCKLIFSIQACLLLAVHMQAQVGIGTNSPHSSAQLEVRSSSKGFLLPSISLTGTNDVSTILSPATGLLVYNSSTVSGANAVNPGFYYFNGAAWVRLVVPADLITSTGTSSYVPKFTSTTTLANSQIFDNATSVGIGVNTPNETAKLEVNSTTQGFLPPRMTAAQRDAIANPAQGLVVYCTDCRELQIYNGSGWSNMLGGPAFTCGSSTVTFTYRGASVTYGTVKNTSTGRCWLDRNLGATRVATSSTDASAYGDLFQWGRGDDGHQLRNSGTTSVLSSSDSPGNNLFILAPLSPYDWRNPQNDNLWQGINRVNNPCPNGWRLPNFAEIDSESLTWSPRNASGAFNSPLKLTLAGYRRLDGELREVGEYGYYWTYTTSSDAFYLLIHLLGNPINLEPRAYGRSVRCIKD